MKVFVLTECAATKKYDPSKAPIKLILEKHGLQIPHYDLENEDKYREVLKGYILPAMDMYEGSFNFVKNLVTQLREKGNSVLLLMISARYGLINEHTPIIPYQCTFKCLTKDEIRERANKLQIYEKLVQIVKNEFFHLSIIILGKDYFLTICDKEKSKNLFNKLKTKRLIVFGSKDLERKIKCKGAKIEFITVKGIGDRNKKIEKFVNKLTYNN